MRSNTNVIKFQNLAIGNGSSSNDEIIMVMGNGVMMILTDNKTSELLK